jgi:acetylornithine deacetylase/succinyl-diaminopimelate desuccinylase-like protein
MHDASGRVTLPGFYDKVRVLPEEERAELARIPISDDAWREMSGTKMLYGEKGFTTAERIVARPTLEVNGIISGFTGEGVKMIVPAKAMANISMRLVPEQDDRAVESQLKEYLRKNAPPTVIWEVKSWLNAPAVLIDRNTPAMRAAASALQATFGVRPVFQLIGGSNASVSMIKARLDVDSVLLGFGMPEDNIHAPNERQHLPTYYRGIETYIRFFDLLSQE